MKFIIKLPVSNYLLEIKCLAFDVCPFSMIKITRIIATVSGRAEQLQGAHLRAGERAERNRGNFFSGETRNRRGSRKSRTRQNRSDRIRQGSQRASPIRTAPALSSVAARQTGWRRSSGEIHRETHQRRRRLPSIIGIEKKRRGTKLSLKKYNVRLWQKTRLNF